MPECDHVYSTYIGKLKADSRNATRNVALVKQTEVTTGLLGIPSYYSSIR